MIDRFTPWKKEIPARAAPDEAALARLRVARWVEFKRLHLGFCQALNAMTYGHSSTLALIRHAMLAEYEARRLQGAAEPEANDPDLTVGEAMRQTLSRCQATYHRVNTKAFDEKALSGLAEHADAHLIALMLSMAAAPLSVADGAVAAETSRVNIGQEERIERFTPEIAKITAQLRAHFINLAQRAGLA